MEVEITGMDLWFDTRIDILKLFTRDNLRRLARKKGGHRGRDKSDLVRILASYPEKLKIRIEVE